MEAQLGVPLDRVRIHTDRVAGEAARALNAKAFTIGEDIFFADGAYAPESHEGQRLLAHELTHVVQAWQGRTGNDGRVSQPGDSLEREADAVADRVATPGDPRRPTGDDAARPKAEHKRNAAVPQPDLRPSARSGAIQRKASDRAPRTPAEHPATVRPPVEARVRFQPGDDPPNTADATFKSRLHDAGRAMKAAFTPFNAGVADAKNVKIGAKAEAKGKHEEQLVDHHIEEMHGHAAKHHAAADAHKKTNHDEPAGVPPPPKLDPHSPIQFKKITDWSKYMPPPMRDQDERERKHILALVKNKIIGEQAASQKTLGALHQAQITAASQVRKMKPGLQAQVANAQKAALGQVASAESTQAAVVGGAYSTAQGRVNAASAAAKARVDSAYSAAIAAINEGYHANDQKLTTYKTNTTTRVSEMEAAQLVSIRSAYQSAQAAVSNNATGEANHARSLGDTVALPYSGDQLDAARDAAHQVADGWANEIPGRMQSDAQAQIFSHQSESETGTTDFAKQQRDQADELYRPLKQALDAGYNQAIQGAGQARDQALQQINSIAASTCASLAAQSASQVASIHQQAASARTSITKAGEQASTGIVSACDKAASGLDGGAAGLVAGAKLVEAPSPELTAQKVAEGEQLLQQGTSSITEGLTKNAGEAAKGLADQAGEAAKGMAALAASAKQAADKAAQSASQSITQAASGSVDSLHKMQENFVSQANDIGSKAGEKFQKIVDDTKATFTDATTKLNIGLPNAVEGLRSNYRSSIDTGETDQILKAAGEAAAQVKPWWQEALAVVCEILVVIVIMVAVTVLTAGLGTGLVAVGIGILAGAAAGAVSSIASQVVGNLIMGEPVFDIDWKEVGISALAGAITGGLAAGAGELGGATVSAAMAGTKGLGNLAIRFGVNAAAGMIGDVGAHLAIDGNYKTDMTNLAIALGTAAITSHSKVIGAQNKLGDAFRAKVGLPPIHVPSIGDTGLGGGGAHSEGTGGGSHPDVGGGKPPAADSKPLAPETGGSKPPVSEDGGGGKPPKTDEGGGGKPPKTDEGGKPPKTDEGGGGKPPKTDEGGGGKPPKTDESGKPPKTDEGGKPPGHDESGKPPGHDEGGKPPETDEDSGKPASHDNGNDSRSLEQQAHDAERDAAMNEDGYVEGTRAKAEETADRIQKGDKPGKDGLRDTEANARGRDDLDKLKEPRIKPEQKKAIDDEVADRVRGKDDPTGKLDDDIKAAVDELAADEKAAKGKGDDSKDTTGGDKGKPGIEPGEKEPDSGLTQEKIDEILGMEKGTRPDPKDYLNPDYIKSQMQKFSEGAARFMRKSAFDKYGPTQVDGTSFVMPKSEADALEAAAGSDPRKLEQALGLPKGTLDGDSMVRIDIPHPEDFGLRIPSGNEAGANDLWLPGGKLPDGASEGVIDGGELKPGTDFTETPVPTTKSSPVKPSDPTSETDPTSGKGPPGKTDPPDPTGVTAPTSGPDPTKDTKSGGGATDPPKSGPDTTTGRDPTRDKDSNPDDPDRARGISGVEDRPPTDRGLDESGKRKTETYTTSLDNRRFHNEMSKLSPEARALIHQIDQRGWVRVDQINPKDLVDISKWYGMEIGVVQSPFGRLRVVLGTEDGILKNQIAGDEVFLIHTHPVVITTDEHFGIDLSHLGKHVEAVIDWSGHITYLSKSPPPVPDEDPSRPPDPSKAIKNPIVNGVVQPLHDYQAAFIDDNMNIVGFARVDIIDGPNGTIVKVRK